MSDESGDLVDGWPVTPILFIEKCVPHWEIKLPDSTWGPLLDSLCRLQASWTASVPAPHDSLLKAGEPGPAPVLKLLPGFSSK